MKKSFLPAAIAVLSSLAAAQTVEYTQTLVPGYNTAVLGSTSGNYTGVANVRSQFLYDSSLFAAQGPITIKKVAWRFIPSASTPTVSYSWPTTTLSSLRLGFSTSPSNATTPSTAFATNQGADFTVGYNGSFTVPAGTATPGDGTGWIEVTLTTPINYNPASGSDLCIDWQKCGTAITGTNIDCSSATTALTRGVRSTATTACTTATTGTVTTFVPVLRVVYDAPPAYVASASVAPAFGLNGTSMLVTCAVSNNATVPGAAATPGSVTINTTNIGGAAGQVMYDDGTNGDTTAGDNVWSLTVVPNVAVGGTYVCPISVTGGYLPTTANANVNIYTVANDIPTGAIALSIGSNGPFTNVGTIGSAHPGYANPNFGTCNLSGSVGVNDVFFSYTPTCNGTLDVTTCNGTNTNVAGELSDTTLSVWSGTTILGCGDDATNSTTCGANGYQSTVSGLAVTAGTTYLIRVSGWGTTAGATTVGTFNVGVTMHTAAKAVVGTGCNGLALDGTLPILGQSGTLTLTGGTANTLGLLAVSFPNGVPAPFGGCTLYLEQESIAFYNVFTTDGTGSYVLTETMPSDPAMNCLKIMTQAFTFGTVLSASNGVQLTFGT